MSERPSIVVTDRDLERLMRLVAAHRRRAEAESLEAEIDRARVVAACDVPRDVVTMNSRVRFEDQDTGERSEVTLVYPNDADAGAGRISVLAPVGSALLGLAAGQVISWPVPGGVPRRLRILEVVDQPEASGRSDL